MADKEDPQTHVLSAEIVPISYYGHEDVVGVYADQAVISHLNGMFTLYFYQMQLPPFTGVTDPVELDQLRGQIKAVPAKCISRIVMTPALAEQFFEAINTNMARYKRKLVDQSQEAKQDQGEGKE